MKNSVDIFRFFKKKKPPRCSVVIAAAGSSDRMNGEDKIYADICGAPVLSHTLRAFQDSGLVSEIIIVTREENISRASAICEKFSISKAGRFVAGGSTRLESVHNGVRAVSRKSSLIAIHDGARACIDGDTIKKAIEAAAKHHAAAPGLPVTSTIKRVKNNAIVETVDREGLVEIQTPQVFDADLIKAALYAATEEAPNITDDCQAVELLGFPVRVIEGSRDNIKITTREDITAAEEIFSRGAGRGIRGAQGG